MADIALSILDTGGADVAIEKGDIRVDPGLETAVLISLFTDARAEPDQDLPDPGELRGWWGEEAGDAFGSRLWLLLERGKRGDREARLARDYALESLQWMLNERVAREVKVAAAFRASDGLLCLEIELLRGTTRRWGNLWNGQSERVLAASSAEVKLLLR